MAGPFTAEDVAGHLIPADKKLTPEWIASLTKRGEPEVFSGEQLKYVGMPVGGIGCGQLYLAGDGRLWLWDIFKCNYTRERDHGKRISAFTLGGHYAQPVPAGEAYTERNGADVAQGFLIRATKSDKTTTRTLDRQGFPDVTFRGEYPIGKVTYAEKGFPLEITLEAFSPFIPLNAKDSALPATVMSYTVTNTSDADVDVDLGSWMQNATCPYLTDSALGQRRNRIIEGGGRVSMLSTVEPFATASSPREDILFADFEAEDWGDWVVEGAAFAGGPFPVKSRSVEQKITGHTGQHIANSYNTRLGGDHIAADSCTGTLVSPEFTVERNSIYMTVGGGSRKGVYVVVMVDGKEVARVAGKNSSTLNPVSIDMTAYQGKKARIHIVDEVTGGWAHITVDQIVFTDGTRADGRIEDKHGYGSTTLTLLDDAAAEGLTVSAAPSLTDPESPSELFKQAKPLAHREDAVKPLGELLVGGLFAAFRLAPGESRTVDFAVTWYFPDYNEKGEGRSQMLGIQDFAKLHRHYAPWFGSAGEVAGYVGENKQRLLGGTRTWNRTWYDSTLPYWLLDRSFIAIDCIASQTFHWFDNGRPYAWEGVDCCPGTCTHVWHYAQSLGRVFPELERAFRERVDFKTGIGFHPDSGIIGHRGEVHATPAIDGQAGSILRAYREHQMSADSEFLKRIWPNVKQATEFLIREDGDGNGLLEGKQQHTLDASWYGPMGWLSGMYLGALAAGEAMAVEMGDTDFARQCRTIIDRGTKNIVAEVFDGEYFIHKPDPAKRALNSNKGCHIDQVLGQAWMHQVGLGRVIPQQETVSALNSLWKYNFAPDAGQYSLDHIEIEKAFRWYAMPGEAGLLMCTWPKGGATEAVPGDDLRTKENPPVYTGPGGYFNECMNGFEYQVAAHMVYEGEPGDALVEKGLAIAKAVHERYGADKRNPYNEIECGDHYARSMASYGVFLAACGFEYHGPKGRIGFAPRISPDNFKAAFTAAEGWGSFAQKVTGDQQSASIELHDGELVLNELAIDQVASTVADRALVVVDGKEIPAEFQLQAGRYVVRFPKGLNLKAGQEVRVRYG
ncbi:GH116 family glycosyl-hydrolase [Novipirellula artificiosorum]|nr:GH116 family glycosyl-hydrolase [Novipirellula artificiosorum]